MDVLGAIKRKDQHVHALYPLANSALKLSEDTGDVVVVSIGVSRSRSEL